TNPRMMSAALDPRGNPRRSSQLVAGSSATASTTASSSSNTSCQIRSQAQISPATARSLTIVLAGTSSVHRRADSATHRSSTVRLQSMGREPIAAGELLILSLTRRRGGSRVGTLNSEFVKRSPMARKSTPTLTDAEARLMAILWERETSTVAEVLTEVRSKRPLTYSTVQTMLRILEEKGYAKHEKVGRAFIYRAV